VPLPITDDHKALAEVARSFLAGQRGAARALLDAPDEPLPAFWKEIAGLGWLGLHVPEEHGGEGAGLPELAVVLEELGRVVAPGPFLPSVLASAILVEVGPPDLQAALLPGLADGSRIGAVGLAGVGTDGEARDDLVLGGALADVVLLVVGDDVLVGEQFAATVGSRVLDPTRRAATVTATGATRIPGAAAVARRLARTLAAAEAAGTAGACLEMAVAYVKQRAQFGRPVGAFQAVKHHCANMLMDIELATAAAWDAQRAAPGTPAAELAAAVAAGRAVPAGVRAAEMAIQLHGGIGFTWEHDCHLHLRRAVTLAAFVDRAGDAVRDTARLVHAGVARTPDLDLPQEAERYRAEARAFVATLDGHDAAARTCPTWVSPAGTSRRSPSTARPNRPSGWSGRPCAARSRGASCSPSRGPGRTPPRSPPAGCGWTAGGG
jgi:3-oxochol-4-en-24-oyl-CoA dehydrogenase